MTDLFFCPERWEPDEMISTNVASLIKVQDHAGRTADAWQLGDWGSDWTAIRSSIPIEAGWLESGGEYRFCFWLNGGENSRKDEVCMLEIYGDEWEERLRFRLNRENCKPLTVKNHWLLFAIPFQAPEAASALHFRFVAAGAVVTLTGIHDMDMSRCEALVPDEPDPPHAQRHNIAFPHGWPDEKPKVVLKARGHELALPKAAVTAGTAAAGLLVGALAVYRHFKRKQR